MIYADVQNGKVSDFIITLMTTYLIDELHILTGAAEKFNWWLHSG